MSEALSPPTHGQMRAELQELILRNLLVSSATKRKLSKSNYRRTYRSGEHNS